MPVGTGVDEGEGEVVGVGLGEGVAMAVGIVGGLGEAVSVLGPQAARRSMSVKLTKNNRFIVAPKKM